MWHHPQLFESSDVSSGLRYHGLSHISSTSWDSHALYGLHCRSLSFSLSSQLWFWRTLTLETLYAGRHSDMSSRQVAKLYHCATPPHALDSCAAAHIFQACRCGRPVRPWTWTGLPGRRPSAGRQDSRSTTPAVIVDVGIGLSMVGDRTFPVAAAQTRNSLVGDVIKFPANLQNQTKISFILVSFP